jgi:hypothetical protein
MAGIKTLEGAFDENPDKFNESPDRVEDVISRDGQSYPRARTAISGLRPAAAPLPLSDESDEVPETVLQIDTARPSAVVDQDELEEVMRQARKVLGFPEPPVFEEKERPTNPEMHVIHKRGYVEDAYDKIKILETLYDFVNKWWTSDSPRVRLWGQLNYLQVRIFTDAQVIADIKASLGEEYIVASKDQSGEVVESLPTDLYALIPVMMDRYNNRQLIEVIRKAR